MKKLLIAVMLLIAAPAFSQADSKELNPLFNGKDFNGWYSFLASSGKNSDPEQVFKIEDGMLHISGKYFGYICTEKEYTNFHLVAEFKWGAKKFPPRDADTTKRDNGICFYIPKDAPETVWPKLVECQVQEGDLGDLWLVDSITVMVNGKRTEPKDYNRVFKLTDAEKPTGEWNTVEIIADNGHIEFIVNGVKVNECEAPSISKGKILVQSEGAEIYYRKIDIAEWK